MKSFSERDVRRHYNLLQHSPELGLTHLKATDGDHVIGIGLFDNQADFVSECRRYNGLGTLYVGVNPRSSHLMEDYGGLRNRMRTLFRDVVTEGDIDFVTGMAVGDPDQLAQPPRKFMRDASVLADGEVFFPLDKAMQVSPESLPNVRRRLGVWLYGEVNSGGVDLMQFVRVAGTAAPDDGWFRRRTMFRRFRPYIMDGISAEIEDLNREPRT
ncbi:MAG: hypothetical protein J4F39_05480 [Candidatus Latescibacteria bacterium]|nr:hypothetical protein [Candidatus Latescibacterota bacterium]